MAAIINDRDITLQATTPRLEEVGSNKIILLSSATNFVKTAGGIQPSSITIKPVLTGILNNLSTLTWNVSPTVTYSEAPDKTITINSSNVTIGTPVTFTATLAFLGITYTTSIVINSLQETIVSTLSKSSVTIATASDGSSGDYTAATSTMTVLVGNTDDSNNWTYSWSVPATVTATGGSTRTITVSAVSVNTPVTLTCTATKTGYTTQTKDFVITKGVAGSNAQLLTLDPTDWAFIFENSTATVATSPASITFTASKQNITGTVTFTATAYNSSNTSLGSVTLTGTGDVRTLTAANFNSLGTTTVRYVKVVATLGTLSDTVTIWRGDNGSDALTFLLTNESHTVPADSSGNVTSYTGAVTYAAIFRGITNETNLWTITKTDSTGLTTTLQGTSAGVNNITVTATALSDAIDSATCTITATRTNYPTLSKVFSISKSKAGSTGGNGINTATIALYNKNTSNSSAPSSFSGTFTYTFSTAALTGGTLNGWSTTAPSISNGEYLWVRYAVASSNTATDTILDTEFSSAIINGIGGINGTRTAILDMYRSSSSTPTTFPSGNSTYTWATGQFTAPATTNGWSITPPTPVAGEILYIVRQLYSDSATTATTSITWSSTTALSISSSGNNGARTAFLEVYQWAASTPTTFPSGTSIYTWATGSFTAPTTANGWSLLPGASTPGYNLYACSVRYTDTGTATTSTITWNTSTAYVVGSAGINGIKGDQGDKGDKGDPGEPGSTGLQGIRSITAYRVRNQTDSPLTTAPSDTSGATAPTDYSLTASSVTVGQVLWYSFGRYNPNASAVEGIPANTTVWSVPIAASIFQDIRSDNWDGYNPANGLTPNNPSTWGTTGYYIDRTNGNIYSTGFYARGSAIFDGSTSTAFAVTTAVRANNTGTADIGVLGLTSNTSGFWGLVGILSNPNGFAAVEGRSLITSKPGIFARNTNNGGTALKIEGWLNWNNYLISPPDGTNTKYLRADGTWDTVSTSSLPSGGTTGQFLRGDGTWSNTLQGNLLVTGEVTAYSGSDIALKQDIARIPNALEKVLSLGGYNFTWTDKHLQSLGSLPENYIKRDDVGIIAQQVLGVLPQAVVTRDDGILAVNYTKLIPLIIEAIIELHKKVSK